VVNERDCPFGTVAAKARVEICAVRSELHRVEDLRLNSLAIENGFEKPRGIQLVAGRVGGIDPQVIRENANTFIIERLPIDGMRLCNEGGSDKEK